MNTHQTYEPQRRLAQRGPLLLRPVPMPDPVLPEGFRYEQVGGVWRVVNVADVAAC
jgi:hypothetical protein